MMTGISKKWDMSRVPENWVFTKAHANGVYKNAISQTRSLTSKLSPGSTHQSLKIKVRGEWYYWVATYLGNHDRFTFTKDLWSTYGFKVHGFQNRDIFVRRK